ncbi:MAG: hypothetical protein ACTHW1_10875 [Ancrocorticia sp.]|uniref:hypothetical protein n=1 Tax=Ancrocorticia sp. TaxID=2593684 RepID=UPI003F92C93C
MRRYIVAMTVVIPVLLIAGCGTGTAEDSATGQSSPQEASDGYPETWDDKLDGKSRDELIEDYRIELLAKSTANAQEYGVDLDIDLEDYPVIRVPEPEEMPEVQAQCLRAQGFDAYSSADGSVWTESVPDDQIPANNRAFTICELQYPIDPVTSGPYPREALDTLYDYDISTVVPCLEELGYVVEEPPSKESWVDAMVVEGIAWNPYDSLKTGELASDHAKLGEIYTACPDTPADFWPSYE